MKECIPESELIINPDGSVYHLHLKPKEIASTIITVGDPARVEAVSKHFDSIQSKSHHREFICHTGYLNNKRLSVISTGMGTDNIDILMNELDALVNIDFKTRTVKDDLMSLEIIRLGTSGSVREELPVDTVLLSEIAIGMDGLMHFYDYENTIHETVYLEAFTSYIKPHFSGVKPYLVSASENLLHRFENLYPKGTTVTACGFYAPQGRTLRLSHEFLDFTSVLNRFGHRHFRITNLEMETAGIYGMGNLLGHHCLSINAILANRTNHTFSKNPSKVVSKMIEDTLEVIVS